MKIIIKWVVGLLLVFFILVLWLPFPKTVQGADGNCCTCPMDPATGEIDWCCGESSCWCSGYACNYTNCACGGWSNWYDCDTRHGDTCYRCRDCTRWDVCHEIDSYDCSDPPACNVTAPTNLSVTRDTLQSSTITWTLGAHGTSQHLYVGDTKAKVEAKCTSGIGPGTGCVIKEENLSASLTTYTTGDVLVLGTIYYWRVENAGACVKPSTTYVSISSCLVSPSSMTMYPGESQTLSTSVNSSTDISVLYGWSLEPFIVLVSPVRDSWYPYSTDVTAYSVGSETITSSVQNTSGTTICSSIANVIVMAPISWWQVKDSDVFSNGSVISPVPKAATFGLSGLGGFPGVIGYGTIYNFSQGTISSKNWIANTVSSSSRIYDYNYFARQLPQAAVDYLNQYPISSFSQATLSGSDGYLDPVSGLTFYKTTSGGEILIDGNIDVGSSKVVLLAEESDVRISGTINLDDGAGLFVLFVGKDANGNRGNIYIEPSVGGAPGGVPQLEGIYLADGIIYTGSLGADLDSQLYVRGSMAGLSGISFQRDMLDNSFNPSELFEYAPDQIMNLLNYPAISAKKMNWKEVAP